jgi:signal transduction protein with GAF and PtsI domain
MDEDSVLIAKHEGEKMQIQFSPLSSLPRIGIALSLPVCLFIVQTMCQYLDFLFSVSPFRRFLEKPCTCEFIMML